MGPGTEGPEEPERFDFQGYLEFLTARGHNFMPSCGKPRSASGTAVLRITRTSPVVVSLSIVMPSAWSC